VTTARRPDPRDRARAGEQAFRGLTESDWRRPTLLQPLDETLRAGGPCPSWPGTSTSRCLTRMLISSQQEGQVAGRVSFFHLLRVEHAPTVYDYAYPWWRASHRARWPACWPETFTRTIEERGRTHGPGRLRYYALMQLVSSPQPGG